MVKKDISGRVTFERAEGAREKAMLISGGWGVGRSAPGREDSICKALRGNMVSMFQELQADQRVQK